MGPGWCQNCATDIPSTLFCSPVLSCKIFNSRVRVGSRWPARSRPADVCIDLRAKAPGTTSDSVCGLKRKGLQETGRWFILSEPSIKWLNSCVTPGQSLSPCTIIEKRAGILVDWGLKWFSWNSRTVWIETKAQFSILGGENINLWHHYLWNCLCVELLSSPLRISRSFVEVRWLRLRNDEDSWCHRVLSLTSASGSSHLSSPHNPAGVFWSPRCFDGVS